MILILSCILWLLFFITHSFFADNRVKNGLTKRLNWKEQHYRFVYSLLSSVLVGFIYILQFTAPKIVLINGHNWLFMLGCVLILNGIIFNLFAFKNISVREFIGLVAHTEVSGKLIQKGVYTIVRHPIYTGLISLIIGVFLCQPTLYNALNFVGILVYLPIGIYLEERKLIQSFGNDYLDYRKKVKAVIPYLI